MATVKKLFPGHRGTVISEMLKPYQNFEIFDYIEDGLNIYLQEKGFTQDNLTPEKTEKLKAEIINFFNGLGDTLTTIRDECPPQNEAKRRSLKLIK